MKNGRKSEVVLGGALNNGIVAMVTLQQYPDCVNPPHISLILTIQRLLFWKCVLQFFTFEFLRGFYFEGVLFGQFSKLLKQN